MAASPRADGLELLASRRPAVIPAYLAALDEPGRSLEPAARRLLAIAPALSVTGPTRGTKTLAAVA